MGLTINNSTKRLNLRITDFLRTKDTEILNSADLGQILKHLQAAIENIEGSINTKQSNEYLQSLAQKEVENFYQGKCKQTKSTYVDAEKPSSNPAKIEGQIKAVLKNILRSNLYNLAITGAEPWQKTLSKLKHLLSFIRELESKNEPKLFLTRVKNINHSLANLSDKESYLLRDSKNNLSRFLIYVCGRLQDDTLSTDDKRNLNRNIIQYLTSAKAHIPVSLLWQAQPNEVYQAQNFYIQPKIRSILSKLHLSKENYTDSLKQLEVLKCYLNTQDWDDLEDSLSNRGISLLMSSSASDDDFTEYNQSINKDRFNDHTALSGIKKRWSKLSTNKKSILATKLTYWLEKNTKNIPDYGSSRIARYLRNETDKLPDGLNENPLLSSSDKAILADLLKNDRSDYAKTRMKLFFLREQLQRTDGNELLESDDNDDPALAPPPSKPMPAIPGDEVAMSVSQKLKSFGEAADKFDYSLVEFNQRLFSLGYEDKYKLTSNNIAVIGFITKLIDSNQGIIFESDDPTTVQRNILAEFNKLGTQEKALLNKVLGDIQTVHYNTLLLMLTNLNLFIDNDIIERDCFNQSKQFYSKLEKVSTEKISLLAYDFGLIQILDECLDSNLSKSQLTELKKYLTGERTEKITGLDIEINRYIECYHIKSNSRKLLRELWSGQQDDSSGEILLKQLTNLRAVLSKQYKVIDEDSLLLDLEKFSGQYSLLSNHATEKFLHQYNVLSTSDKREVEEVMLSGGFVSELIQYFLDSNGTMTPADARLIVNYLSGKLKQLPPHLKTLYNMHLNSNVKSSFAKLFNPEQSDYYLRWQLSALADKFYPSISEEVRQAIKNAAIKVNIPQDESSKESDDYSFVTKPSIREINSVTNKTELVFNSDMGLLSYLRNDLNKDTNIYLLTEKVNEIEKMYADNIVDFTKRLNAAGTDNQRYQKILENLENEKDRLEQELNNVQKFNEKIKKTNLNNSYDVVIGNVRTQQLIAQKGINHIIPRQLQLLKQTSVDNRSSLNERPHDFKSILNLTENHVTKLVQNIQSLADIEIDLKKLVQAQKVVSSPSAEMLTQEVVELTLPSTSSATEIKQNNRFSLAASVDNAEEKIKYPIQLTKEQQEKLTSKPGPQSLRIITTKHEPDFSRFSGNSVINPKELIFKCNGNYYYLNSNFQLVKTMGEEHFNKHSDSKELEKYLLKNYEKVGLFKPYSSELDEKLNKRT